MRETLKQRMRYMEREMVWGPPCQPSSVVRERKLMTSQAKIHKSSKDPSCLLWFDPKRFHGPITAVDYQNDTLKRKPWQDTQDRQDFNTLKRYVAESGVRD